MKFWSPLFRAWWSPSTTQPTPSGAGPWVTPIRTPSLWEHPISAIPEQTRT